jgi:hypothetical protein
MNHPDQAYEQTTAYDFAIQKSESEIEMILKELKELNKK